MRRRTRPAAAASAAPARSRAAVPHPRPTLSFCDFVDDALFHPRWGYYSTGAVRFGIGGHYDTYPLALSPLFGRMVAGYAFRLWRRRGSPRAFEVCELGAGNGQLCLDTLLWIRDRGRRDRTWRAFGERLRYRILERSRALIARQRRQLGPLADAVRWSRADISRAAPRLAPLARHGLIVANEVFDCLPHHKVVAQRSGDPAAAFVVAERDGRALDRRQLAEAMASPAARRRVRFREVLQPIARLPGLAAFVRRQCPELLAAGAARAPYFAAPRLATMLKHAAHLYEHADALWIDYGDERDFHLRTAESKRVFAGSPRSRARVYDHPGREDITFMVDFTAAKAVARDAGWKVVYYGPQAELARRAGVRLDRRAADLIVQHRALGWLLAVVGVGPERSWQQPAVAWSRGASAGRVSVRRYVEQSIRAFGDARRSPFKLLITRR